MITATNDDTATRAIVSNGAFSFIADTKPPKGGGEGLGPHEILEAALASCTAITLRLVARERGIPLGQFSVRVELDRTEPARPILRTHIDFAAEVADGDRRMLLAAARRCPVHKTLAADIGFEEPT
jgi:putative redox protein